MFDTFLNTHLVDIVSSSTLALGLTIISGVTAVPVEASTFSLVSGFEGAYDPINWTLTNNNADGFVDITDAPNSITLTGGNNQSFRLGITSLTISAPVEGSVSFDYDYNSLDDDGAFFDPFGFLLNGNFIQITDDSGADNQTGGFSLGVNQGDIFGFAIQTLDNSFGPGVVKISNFEAHVSVPEPGTILGFLTIGGLGLVMERKKHA